MTGTTTRHNLGFSGEVARAGENEAYQLPRCVRLWLLASELPSLIIFCNLLDHLENSLGHAEKGAM